MAESQIRWKRGDYVRLGQAVAQFNRKINKLQSEEKRLYLPDTIEYNDTKAQITTRNELNRIINSLKRFKNEGAEELYITEAGEQITKWERNELRIETGIITRRINQEIQKLHEPISSGFSRAQMGSQELRRLEAQKKNLGTLEQKKGYEFQRLRNRIHEQGSSDYVMRRSINYRNNYIKEMEKYVSFNNYDKFMNYLKSITNPIEFFEKVSVNELTSDLTLQSDQFLSQERFNEFVQMFDIEVDDSITKIE